MTDNDVKRVFIKKIDSIGRIILSVNSWVEVDYFVALFDGASSTPTYNELVALDGGRLGYIPFFDECKEEGILN